MTTYAVLKKTETGAGIHWPGEQIEDPDSADVLIERGFVSELPGTRTEKAPPTREERADALMEQKRPALNAMALDAGIAEPKDLANKAAVVEAILDAEDAKAEETDAAAKEAAKAARAAARAEKEARDAQALESALADRPEAQNLADAMEVDLEEVLALSDEEYKAGVQAFIINASTETTEAPSGTAGAESPSSGTAPAATTPPADNT